MSLHITRPVSLALTSAIAFIAAFAALAVAGGSPAQGHSTAEARDLVTKSELAFRNDMRKLWEDHIVWTRMAIVSLTTDAPDTGATVGRLLDNQTDIGDAVKPFYGDAAGEELTRLLREHIVVAADVVAAAKAGDEEKLATAQAAWQANADAIARFLHSANPRHWPLEELKTMLADHLELTTREAVARLQGNWAADIAAYDAIHVQALHMADMLSTGIVEQFPRRFR